jgi:hypothetical protein
MSRRRAMLCSSRCRRWFFAREASNVREAARVASPNYFENFSGAFGFLCYIPALLTNRI